jgi:hypothetical protein
MCGTYGTFLAFSNTQEDFVMKMKGWIAMALLALGLGVGTGCTTGDALSEPRFAAPVWAPPYGSEARYYYMPDMEVYYDAYTGNFVFWDGFGWTSARSLPPAYRNYDLYDANIILLDTRVNAPWLYHNHYITRYPKGYYSGPRTNPQTNQPSRNYPSRVFDENESNVDIPVNPRGIDPSDRIDKGFKPNTQPRSNERPQIRSYPEQKQTIPRSQQQKRSPSSSPQKVRPGQGKG